MRKLIILILALVTIPLAAIAAVPDISGLSRDELIELNHQIQLKLFSESLVNGVVVPAGIYTVGTDIPVGMYRIVFNQKTDYHFGSFTYYDQNGNMVIYEQLGFSGSSEIGKLEMLDGFRVYIDGGEVTFYAYSGLFH